MGSRSKTDLAYIAGFLDGDGSLMIQIKKRGDTDRGIRFMLTICLYQDSRHDEPLYWIRKVFNIGYISKRNDNITELRINGFSTVKEILESLLPYLKFKRKQAELMIEAAAVLASDRLDDLSKSDLKKLAGYVEKIQSHNYKSSQRRSKQELFKVLGLTP